MKNAAIKRLSTLMLILACCLSFSDAYAELIAEPLAAIPVGPSGENLQNSSLATNQLDLDLINKKVDAQSSVITLGLSFIGTLLVIIGLVFPSATYFLSILPAQKALKQAQETMGSMDEKFADLLASHRSREIDGAIKSLQSSDGFDVFYPATALQLALITQQATDSQVSEIVHLARRPEVKEIKEVLIQSLAMYQTSPVSTLFGDLSDDTELLKEHFQAIGRYLELSNDDEVWHRLKQRLKTLDDPANMILKLAKVSRKQKKGSEKRYVNDKELVESLDFATKSKLYSSLEGSNFNKDILSSSLLHKFIKDAKPA